MTKESWAPLTPPSILLAIPPPTLLNNTTFEQLPPPLSEFRVNQSKTFSDDFTLPRFNQKRTVDSILKEDETTGLIGNHSATVPQVAQTVHSSSFAYPHSLPSPTALNSEQSTSVSKKRPKREASSSKNLSEQNGGGSDYEVEVKPVGTAKNGQSNRKVSHSLIERRRREKINDALSALKRIVPHCREEGERKEQKAKERGRKRGKVVNEGEDEGGRGGLHKLEILQGTIAYIQQLELKVTALESDLTLSHQLTSSRQPPVGLVSPRQSHSRSFSPLSPTHLSPQQPLIEPYEALSNRVTGNRYHAAFTQPQHARNSTAGQFSSIDSMTLPPITLAPIRSQRRGSIHQLISSGRESDNGREAEEDIAAGLLLLKYSCSPELRPVFYE